MLFSDAGKAVRFDENDVRRWAAPRAVFVAWSSRKAQSVIALLVADRRKAVAC